MRKVKANCCCTVVSPKCYPFTQWFRPIDFYTSDPFVVIYRTSPITAGFVVITVRIVTHYTGGAFPTQLFSLDFISFSSVPPA